MWGSELTQLLTVNFTQVSGVVPPRAGKKTPLSPNNIVKQSKWNTPKNENSCAITFCFAMILLSFIRRLYMANSIPLLELFLSFSTFLLSFFRIVFFSSVCTTVSISVLLLNGSVVIWSFNVNLQHLSTLETRSLVSGVDGHHQLFSGLFYRVNNFFMLYVLFSPWKDWF